MPCAPRKYIRSSGGSRVPEQAGEQRLVDRVVGRRNLVLAPPAHSISACGCRWVSRHSRMRLAEEFA